MSSFSCSRCQLSACRTRFEKLNMCRDQQALGVVAQDFPEVAKLLHLDCKTCNDDFLVLRFSVQEKEIFVMGHHDANGFVIQDKEGKKHQVAVGKHARPSEEKCQLKAFKAYCHYCALDICEGIGSFVKLEKNEDPFVFVIEEDEQSTSWKLIQSCDPTTFCIHEGCSNEKGPSGLCKKHFRRQMAKNAIPNHMEQVETENA